MLSNPSDPLMGENGATKLNAAHITIEHGISSTELEKKLLTPSASSIVLELLGRTAKQKSSELGIIITPSASSAVRCNHNTAQMSANNPVVPNTSEGAGDGNPPINLPPSKQKPNHNSVVPQLMDIYDDLAQSSTPQTTTMSSVPMTQAQSTMGGVHYPGYLSLDSNSQTSERSTRRRSGSQSPHTAAEADASSATSVALARARRTNAKFKAYDDLEEHYGGSVGSKQPVRKKGKVSSADNRWSKRFTWPDELHRDFVSAIFDVGLKHASPSAILEFMTPNPDITSERVKSHLQKYRLNRQKSRKEFMQNYDCALEGYQTRVGQSLADGEEENTEEQGTSLSCGEAAALCTFATLTERALSVESLSRAESRGSSPALVAAAPISSASHVSADGEGVGTLQLPLLTTQEKDGPIGQAFGYLVGLYQVLSQQLEGSRQEQGESKSSPKSQVQTHHQHATEQSVSQDQPRPQVDHQITVNQAAATAASMRDSDPYIHEVAALIPHASHLMVSQPAGQSPTSPRYTGVYHQQQHHYSSPIHQQYSQHSQRQYNVSSTSQKGEYARQGQGVQHPKQLQQHPQSAYGAAPARNQPSYSPLQLPSNRASEHQELHPSDRQQFYPSVATVSHHGTSAPSIPPLAAGLLRNIPEMRHPSAPQSISVPSTQKYYPQMTQEEFQSHAHTLPQSAPNSAAQPTSDNMDITNATVNNPLGSGRTLQAQKESTMMKQEMRGQMVFQNKMRELKQKELSKCGGKEHTGGQRHDSVMKESDGSKAALAAWGASSANGAPQLHEELPEQYVDMNASLHQMSEEPDNDLIWNHEDDDQIFDFLMEHS